MIKKILFAVMCLLCFKVYSQEDWANLKRYSNENKLLDTPATGEKRVVFMGNSITEGWIKADSLFFAGRPYINRGISGQTTSQMLLRFRQDVTELKPMAVVILAGINDIAENTGPITLEAIFGNIVSMIQLAQCNNIKAILCSVLPANKFSWRPAIQPAEKVIVLNKMLKDYAKQNKIEFVDYYRSMVDNEKGLPKKYAADGIHPTLEGYKVMEPLVEEGIKHVINKK